MTLRHDTTNNICDELLIVTHIYVYLNVSIAALCAVTRESKGFFYFKNLILSKEKSMMKKDS